MLLGGATLYFLGLVLLFPQERVDRFMRYYVTPG